MIRSTDALIIFYTVAVYLPQQLVATAKRGVVIVRVGDYRKQCALKICRRHYLTLLPAGIRQQTGPDVLAAVGSQYHPHDSTPHNGRLQV
ncbi:MAG: hypothetical protein ACLU40_03240 [Acutalibacteraceae bacterium]